MNQTNQTRHGYARASLAIAFALMLGGCATTVRIGDLLAEPSRYQGKTVQVEGTVTQSAGVLGVGGYQVDDGTGQIYVVAQGTGVPVKGARTKAKGQFQPVFSLLGRNIAAIVQGTRRSDEQ